MASITKIGNTYHVRVRIKGITKCSSFPTMAKAKAWADKTSTEIRNGFHVGETGNRFSDAVERFSKEITPSRRGQKAEYSRLKAFSSLPFCHYKISDINARVLAEWRDKRLTEVSDGTVIRELNLMSAIFEQARREWRWISSNPVREIRKPTHPKHRDRIFTKDEQDSICVALGFDGGTVRTFKDRVAVTFLFAIQTGMRRGEILGLTWDRIDQANQVLTLEQTKNGDARKVPLSQAAVKLLTLVKDFDTPFGLTPGSLSLCFMRACKRAGISNAHFHDTRHTAITALAKKLSPMALARMIGHRDLNSLMVYYNETAEELAKMLD